MGSFKQLPSFFEKRTRERAEEYKIRIQRTSTGRVQLLFASPTYLPALNAYRGANNSLSLSQTPSDLASTLLLSFHLNQEERQIVGEHGGEDGEAAFKEGHLIAFFSYKLFFFFFFGTS